MKQQYDFGKLFDTRFVLFFYIEFRMKKHVKKSIEVMVFIAGEEQSDTE